MPISGNDAIFDASVWESFQTLRRSSSTWSSTKMATRHQGPDHPDCRGPKTESASTSHIAASDDDTWKIVASGGPASAVGRSDMTFATSGSASCRSRASASSNTSVAMKTFGSTTSRAISKLTTPATVRLGGTTCSNAAATYCVLSGRHWTLKRITSTRLPPAVQVLEMFAIKPGQDHK